MSKKVISKQTAKLTLQDGNVFEGKLFGASKSIAGEVVFNTGMVGYPETLTDPSYKGQILVMTYPLVGNYGVPATSYADSLLLSKKSMHPKTESAVSVSWDKDLPKNFESDRVQVQALIVSENSNSFSHWNSIESLDSWLKRFAVPGIHGIDTRQLTKILREHGTMLGKIEISGEKIDYYNPDIEDLISKVTATKVEEHGSGKKRILLIDCGCKKSILTNLIKRKVSVLRVPYDYDVDKEDYDGVLLSNGPGNPVVYKQLVASVKKLLHKQVPTLGICMGHQILSLAAGATTYKLKYGHRSQNQPVKQVDSNKCYITSQNHSFAVSAKSLPRGWEPWFENLNDYSNEGVRHEKLPFRSVQFHPEAMPGPVDSAFIFDEFLKDVK
ncbi:carbamoyl-phosphate synthase (glutamine-hydrolyzing) small subunit [bacterium]|nr:carbamoyl-phosphate synthase (glutamine-hydrolyzing) small subunit [bacterium]